MKYFILFFLFFLFFSLNGCTILYYHIHKDDNGLYINYKGNRKPILSDNKSRYFINDKGNRVNLGATKAAYRN